MDRSNRMMEYFENLLEDTFEQKLLSWLPEHSERTDVIQKIVDTLQSQNNHAAIYDILLHVSNEDYSIWFNNQSELIELSNRIYQLAQKENIPLPRPPAFHIFAEPGLIPGQISVDTVPNRSFAGKDQGSDHSSKEDDEGTVLYKTDNLPTDRLSAFLTNSENKVIPLIKSTINIGRKEDNDIVISDQRVSRLHAQIRLSQGNYVIFDLNSTSGTFINDQKINQHRLVTGDVISFGGVTFIFVLEENDQLDESTRDLQGKTVAPPAVRPEDRIDF